MLKPLNLRSCRFIHPDASTHAVSCLKLFLPLSLFLPLYLLHWSFPKFFLNQKVYITNGQVTDTMNSLTPSLLIFLFPNYSPSSLVLPCLASVNMRNMRILVTLCLVTSHILDNLTLSVFMVLRRYSWFFQRWCVSVRERETERQRQTDRQTDLATLLATLLQGISIVCLWEQSSIFLPFMRLFVTRLTPFTLSFCWVLSRHDCPSFP